MSLGRGSTPRQTDWLIVSRNVTLTLTLTNKIKEQIIYLKLRHLFIQHEYVYEIRTLSRKPKQVCALTHVTISTGYVTFLSIWSWVLLRKKFGRDPARSFQNNFAEIKFCDIQHSSLRKAGKLIVNVNLLVEVKFSHRVWWPSAYWEAMREFRSGRQRAVREEKHELT
jgi:hypothetical protein